MEHFLHLVLLSLVSVVNNILLSNCTTDYGRGKPCSFPFKIDGEIYFSCTSSPQDRSESKITSLPVKCPTSVDRSSLEASPNEDDWDICDRSCPLRNYRNNQELQDHLQTLQNSNSNIAKYFTIGKSVEGRDIFGIRITSGADLERKLLKASVALIGNMHGNEVVCREVLTHLATVLVRGYEEDSRIQALLDSVEIQIIPTLNPDGWARSEEGDCGGQDYYSGRLNTNRVDLNRNFPVRGVETQRSSVRDLEPETSAVVEWLSENWFVLGANFHGGAVVASYPWDHQEVIIEITILF